MNDIIFKNLTGNLGIDLQTAQKRGDWVDTKMLTNLGPEYIINEITISGLRGRGGAGFYTGKKWSFMPKSSSNDKPAYLIVNADESEPGTCKDRDIIRYEPHKIIEGALLAAFAIRAHTGYIYIRGEYYHEAQILQNSINEAYTAGLLGNNAANTGWDFNLYLHRGAGAYICGDESALMESLEGKKGFPRLKPPFPAMCGLYNCPTTINNVETIASITTILRKSGKWFKQLGTNESSGTKIYCISGHINKPCNVELPLGIKLKVLIEEYAGGVIGGWDNLLAVIPGGSSTPVIPKAICEDITMDFESLAKVNSALGTAGVIVMNKSTDMVQAITNLAQFYAHESCGQCTPCREGINWIYQIMQKICTNQANAADIDKLVSLTQQIEGRTICAFGDTAVWPIKGLIRHFRHLLPS